MGAEARRIMFNSKEKKQEGGKMANLVKWIENAADGEEIIGVVIGDFGWGGFLEERCPKLIPKEKRGVVLPWDEAKELLDYEFDDGYGAPGCHAIYAWTKNKVIFVGTYDGSTWIESVPRNPVDCNPHMIGC